VLGTPAPKDAHRTADPPPRAISSNDIVVSILTVVMVERGSAVLHCTGRKDRTGLATAMLLS
jgi:protein tyrosine/serine phosphatase